MKADDKPETCLESLIGMKAEAVVSAVVGVMFSVFIVYGVAFAPGEATADAVRDPCHTMTYPCH